jgi:dCMP deaminase
MRLSRPQMFMEMAIVASKRSTCMRANVGAVIVYEDNVISIGYNGPPSGDSHCKGNECELNQCGGCLRSVHAERNAINRVTKDEEISTKFWDKASLYSTHQPCFDCAQYMALLRINTVFYKHSYRDPAGLNHLLEKGIRVIKVTENGMIHENTGQIITEQGLKETNSKN